MINIGNNIKHIRELKNLTQEAVAEAADMSVTAYGNIERGTADVGFKRLAIIAKALDVCETDIVGFGQSAFANNANIDTAKTAIGNHIHDNHVTNYGNGSGHVVVFTNNVYMVPSAVNG